MHNQFVTPPTSCEHIARVAAFLASDDAGWLTGEIIYANGGK